MKCWMLRHKFSDSFYSKHDRGTAAVIKEGTGKLFKTRWSAELALSLTKLKDLQLVEVYIDIKAATPKEAK